MVAEKFSEFVHGLGVGKAVSIPQDLSPVITLVPHMKTGLSRVFSLAKPSPRGNIKQLARSTWRRRLAISDFIWSDPETLVQTTTAPSNPQLAITYSPVAFIQQKTLRPHDILRSLLDRDQEFGPQYMMNVVDLHQPVSPPPQGIRSDFDTPPNKAVLAYSTLAISLSMVTLFSWFRFLVKLCIVQTLHVEDCETLDSFAISQLTNST